MDQSPDNSAKGSPWIFKAPSLVLVLCLLVGQGLRISGAVDDFLAANSDSYFANSHQRESAVVALEKQNRIRSKAPRRDVQFGALPPSRAPEVSTVCCELSHARGRWQTQTTHSQPNDRGPPALTI